MRIISGKFRGKSIIAPRSLPVRPTTDFAKEALFNLVRNHFDFEDISVLDLFSGTGNISYEFASRGTEDITAVDASFDCVKFIRQTANQLEFTGLQGVKADALKFASRAYRNWDLIFADPPYDYPEHLALVDAILNNKLLTEEGILIIEHGKDTDLSNHPRLTDSRKYGNVRFSFFE